MTMQEFNKALRAVESLLTVARASWDPNDIATLMIALAIHGLVLLPIDPKSTTIPQPICYTIRFPFHDHNNGTIWGEEYHYLIPADQIAA